MIIDSIRTLVAAEMQQVDQTIADQFNTDVSLIEKVSQHIFGGGGKRLRPLLVLLSAKAFGYQGAQHIELAAIVELIHTATLIHDDVVDHSSLRRGKKTANIIWGNEASVLVGDFLYSRAFQMMVKVESMTVMAILADAANTIAEGEVMQLIHCNDPDTSEAQYMETILRKTATLFEASSQLGAIIANQSNQFIQAMAQFGLQLGMAFQLVDDALDYGASSENIGKNIGDDLAEGKPTYPLIHILQQGNAKEIALVRNAIQKGKANDSDNDITLIQQAIERTNAIEHTYAAATKKATLARDHLAAIPKNPHQQALLQLTDFVVERQF